MGDAPSRAELIGASSFGARSPIAATVSRAELEEALRVEEVPELVLGVDSRSNGDVEAHTLRVAWTDDQLKELLRDTSGDDITLYFDAEELQRALAGEDIEAHGMREKTAAVITVAAMAAGIGASAHAAGAQTMIGSGTAGAAGGTIEMVSDAASSGVQAAPELVSDAGSSGGAGVGAAPAAGPQLISDAASGPGVDVVRASGPELISDAASGPGVDVVRSSGPELVSDVASGPGGGYAAPSSGPELVSDAASTGTLSAAQSSQAAALSATGSDSSWSTSEIAGTAAIGGVVLLITAAGFATRGRHRGGAQPA
jgi:hypothetical protein